jgi:hypothetical protein
LDHTVGRKWAEIIGFFALLLCGKLPVIPYGTQMNDKLDIFNLVTFKFVEENVFKLKVLHPHCVYSITRIM